MAQISGIPLFRLFGIQVSLHWTWFIIVYIAVQQRVGFYSSPIWNVVEVLSLFGIILMHEFGHALACRSVGGRAEHIMLWPLGGVAFVDPPQRPGAVLWSIAAGPLVNVVLYPVTVAFWHLAPPGDIRSFANSIWFVNALLLGFNMLPIYPLDGGQILRAILWFFIGAARSLKVASVIGLIGAALGFVVAMAASDIWLVVIAMFVAMQSWAGFQQSDLLSKAVRTSRRPDARCPACGISPPRHVQLKCSCGTPFDVFTTGGRCPNCGMTHNIIQCPDCGQLSHPSLWRISPTVYVVPGDRPA